jgi:hypothetical protein
LVFLGRGRFAAKAPVEGYWFSLEFFGFSRPNRELSMGYAELGAKYFSRALWRWNRRCGPLSFHEKRRDSSWAKLNLISDFLQLMLVGQFRTRSQFRAHCQPMSNMLRNAVGLRLDTPLAEGPAVSFVWRHWMEVEAETAPRP